MSDYLLTILTIVGAIVGIITGIIAGNYHVYGVICKHNIDGEDAINPTNNLTKKDKGTVFFGGLFGIFVGALLTWAAFTVKSNEKGALLLVALFGYFLGGLLLYAGITGKAHKMQ